MPLRIDSSNRAVDDTVGLAVPLHLLDGEDLDASYATFIKRFKLARREMDIIQGTAFTDEIYVNGSVVRTDKNISAVPELLQEVKTTFPAFATFLDNSAIAASDTPSYREPYQNRTISIMCVAKEIPSQFNAKFTEWPQFSIKFDMTTQKAMLKVNTPPHDASPELLAFADISAQAIHIHEDSGLQPYTDFYGRAFPDDIRDYCTKHGLTYPIPENIEDEVWIWSFVYHYHTPYLVKAYRVAD